MQNEKKLSVKWGQCEIIEKSGFLNDKPSQFDKTILKISLMHASFNRDAFRAKKRCILTLFHVS